MLVYFPAPTLEVWQRKGSTPQWCCMEPLRTECHMAALTLQGLCMPPRLQLLAVQVHGQDMVPKRLRKAW